MFSPLFPQGRPQLFAGRIFLQPALVHNLPMSLPAQQTPPIEERIGSMVGKIVVLGLCALLLWGYSTTFLAQLGLF
jgi:hypothetical protein